MSEAVNYLNNYTTEQFLSSDNLVLVDATVTEVFSMMLGIDTEVHPEITDVEMDLDPLTAVVGYSGTLRGLFGLRVSTVAAREIASAMMGGMPIDEDDDSVGDAVGELCNMLAGGWKNRIPALASRCSLSPPTVISGMKYRVHMSTKSVDVERTYCFNGHTALLTVHCEDLA
jgi:chemotaxis protein CheX